MSVSTVTGGGGGVAANFQVGALGYKMCVILVKIVAVNAVCELFHILYLNRV